MCRPALLVNPQMKRCSLLVLQQNAARLGCCLFVRIVLVSEVEKVCVVFGTSSRGKSVRITALLWLRSFWTDEGVVSYVHKIIIVFLTGPFEDDFSASEASDLVGLWLGKCISPIYSLYIIGVLPLGTLFFLEMDHRRFYLGRLIVEPGKASYDPELTGMGVKLQLK